MTDDKIVKDSARDPEREALGSMRGGIRAAAGRAARKVAKKVAKKAAQKKTTKKTTTKATAAAGKTTKKAGSPAAKPDKSAPAAVSASAPRTTAARAPAARTEAARARAATTTSRAPRAPEAAAAGSVTTTKHVAGAGAVPPYQSGASIEAPPPPPPMHPGAAMASMQEHAGGLGSLLALWGPLIIVGFLVLVFRGGEERESTVATGPDAPSQMAMDSARGTSHGARDGGTMNPAAGAPPSTRPSGSPGGMPGAPEAFDGGFTMRTSMAGLPVFAGREPGAEMPAGAPGRLYPSPSGPYRDPRYRGLPTGESWSSDDGGEWRWSADGRAASSQDDGGSAPVQWVRCAPPYYWCPAPSSPAW